MIEIKTQKVVKHGIIGRIITSIRGCECKTDLPMEYLYFPLHCYMGERDDDETVLYISKGINLVENVFYNEISFVGCIRKLKECSKNLQIITNQMKNEWNGDETILI